MATEFLPEKCSRTEPLCRLLSLSSSSCGSAAFSLLFGADATASVATVSGDGVNAPHTQTHAHTLTLIQQECA